MNQIKELKSAIESLPNKDFHELREWFFEKEWEKWDKELESDSNSGKLDFLSDEANKENNLQDINHS